MTPTPREETYSDYMSDVATAAEAALTEMEDDEALGEAEAAELAISGSQRITDYGHMLNTVLYSDQSPETPEYCAKWQDRMDTSNDDQTWDEYVSTMAQVCFYSDVREKMNRMQDEASEE